MTPDRPSSATCHICLDPEPLSEDASATCNQCHRPFHLRLRNNDTTGKDCGDVWIDENYLSLEFACNECLGVTLAGNVEPSVGSEH